MSDFFCSIPVTVTVGDIARCYLISVGWGRKVDQPPPRQISVAIIGIMEIALFLPSFPPFQSK